MGDGSDGQVSFDKLSVKWMMSVGIEEEEEADEEVV